MKIGKSIFPLKFASKNFITPSSSIPNKNERKIYKNW